MLPDEGLEGHSVSYGEAFFVQDDPVAQVEENGVPIGVGHHGVGLLIGIPLDAGLGVADDLILVKFIGTLPHAPLELPLGGAELEGLPGDGHQQQQHAIQQQQAAYQALVGIAIGTGHETHYAQQPAHHFGSPGLVLSDAGLGQVVQGGEGLDVIRGVVDKGIQGFRHKIPPFSRLW